MKLQNPFSQETRNLYLSMWECMECRGNGQSCGGLELNHILGRESDSPLNASVLCKTCHGHVGHSREEHQRLFLANLKYLWSIGYSLTNDDYEFMRNRPELVTREVLQFVRQRENIDY